MKTEDPTLPGTHANDHEFVAQSQRVIDELLIPPPPVIPLAVAEKLAEALESARTYFITHTNMKSMIDKLHSALTAFKEAKK